MCVECNCYYVFLFVVFLLVSVLFACATVLHGELLSLPMHLLGFITVAAVRNQKAP